MKRPNIWETFWLWAGRVPLRTKIIGIVIAPLLILGTTMAWWVRNELGGWLSYLLSEERVAQAMSVGMRGVFIVTLIAAVSGLGIAWFLTWLLSRPILQITHVAMSVKNGDLSLRAPVWANDEIGDLGRAFNAMIDSLQRSRGDLERSNQQLTERNNELGVLYDLARIAGRPHTPGSVLGYSLRRSLDVIEADAGMVIAFAGETLAIAASFSLSQVFLEASTHDLASVAFFRALTERDEMCYIPDIATYPAAPELLVSASQREGLVAYVVIPLLSKNSVLGALAILSAQPMVLDERNQRLLAGICGQLSVTIENNHLWEELKQKERLRAQLLNKIVSAQEEERQRISRELHDETGQALTSLLIQLKILERQNTLDAMKAQVQEMRDATAQTLQEVRRLAADLRPAALDDLGLMAALESYTEEFSRATAIPVTFQAPSLENVRLPHNVEITLYRVIQESLTNIARHAEATRAEVSLMLERSAIRALIVDNGCGFDIERTLGADERGLGLLGMQERIELLSGTLKLESQAGQGTRIQIHLPIPEET
ncbi:MAG TPA: HAMP domain-containing protein [Aggregatilinea sp.]|uniref:HAMP domain-containing protein n=1 Tax=Aggregatilinea sp. TaxID=2806333 RepID=UPI002B82262D|nr:HAMP domain-containing protein [Aggregatilinea sp.]HML22389.1 HAMP domain-containing protein [Aggregatilinea sp.]